MNMSSRIGALGWIALCALLFGLGSVDLEAQTPRLVGGRAGVYADGSDAFIGGEFLTPLIGRLYFNPNVEYIFAEKGKAATFNLDFHYDFPLGRRTFTWAGLGLGILYNDPEAPAGGDIGPAANILFGLGVNRGAWMPYVQAKVIASADSDFAIGGGIRFVLE
jgi:hypothetical protein